MNLRPEKIMRAVHDMVPGVALKEGIRLDLFSKITIAQADIGFPASNPSSTLDIST